MEQVSLEDEKFYKGDEVEVTAEVGDNRQYKGRHGTVLSDAAIPGMAGYYYVRLEICHIFIHGGMLKLIERAPAGGGASGAP